MGESSGLATPHRGESRINTLALRLGIAVLVPAIAVLLHELGHLLSHIAFGYTNVSLSFDGVSTGAAPGGVNAQVAEGVSFAAGTGISLSLALAALWRPVPSALAAALGSFEVLRAGIGLGVAVSGTGVRALWGGVGELRYLASAFEWPTAVGALLGCIELGVPIVVLVALLRRTPRGQRLRVMAPAFAGSVAGLALWLTVVGPLLLP